MAVGRQQPLKRPPPISSAHGSAGSAAMMARWSSRSAWPPSPRQRPPRRRRSRPSSNNGRRRETTAWRSGCRGRSQQQPSSSLDQDKTGSSGGIRSPWTVWNCRCSSCSGRRRRQRRPATRAALHNGDDSSRPFSAPSPSPFPPLPSLSSPVCCTHWLLASLSSCDTCTRAARGRSVRCRAYGKIRQRSGRGLTVRRLDSVLAHCHAFSACARPIPPLTSRPTRSIQALAGHSGQEAKASSGGGEAALAS